MSDSETQKDSTSKKDRNEQILQAIAKKRKAHLPKTQVVDVKKVKPHENKETEKNKQSNDVNEKNYDNKDRPLKDSFYKCTCEGKFIDGYSFSLQLLNKISSVTTNRVERKSQPD